MPHLGKFRALLHISFLAIEVVSSLIKHQGTVNMISSNLIYSGKGKLFTAINEAIDPINISHPIWDEKLLLNTIDQDSWIDGYAVPAEAISYDNEVLFNLRKRQFFFFNRHGIELLTILDMISPGSKDS